jgi:hypothetical protein
VKIYFDVFWDNTTVLSQNYPEDGGQVFFRNSEDYAVVQSKWPPSFLEWGMKRKMSGRTEQK